nr:hypothetical protein [uncultured Gellertiella sp.]
MTYLRALRVIAGASGLLVAGLGLSGCLSSPTYGTGVSAGEQLVDDIGAAATIGSNTKTKGIKYTPRPGLVVPPPDQQAALVAPQASLADKSNGQWVESPEETRARLAQEAEDNRDNTNFRSPLVNDRALTKTVSDAQLAQFRAGRTLQKGDYSGRRYLSDPPTAYREADPAALTDLGEPETAKEKRRRKAAAVSGSGSKWWMPFN